MNGLFCFVLSTLIISWLVDCSHLNEKRFPIENINFDLVKTTETPAISNLITKNEFESKILFDQLSVSKHEFKLGKFYDNLIVQLGKDSTKWVLAKQSESDYIDVYQSNGVSYVQYKNDLLNMQINNMIINPNQPDMFVFTNVVDNYLILSFNNGVNLTVYKTEFKPEYVYFTRDASVFIVHDASNQKLWFTQDSGHSWKLVSDSVIKAIANDKSSVYYIKKAFMENQLFLFDSENSIQISSDASINDVEKVADYLFLIQTSPNSTTLELLASKNGPHFEKANIISETPIEEIKVVLVSKSEIFISLTYSNLKSDLFVSKATNPLNFELSLANFESIVSFDVENNVYAANARLGESIVTFIKTSKSEWKQTRHETDSIALHLDLKNDFIYKHEDAESSFATQSFSNLMIASDSDMSAVYLSHGDNEWSKILDGTYLYATSYDDSALIVAIKKNELTNSIIYSQDNGNSWNEYQFSKNYIYSNMIINEATNTNRFILYCTRANKKSRSIITLEFRSADSGYEASSDLTSDEEFDLNGAFQLETSENSEKNSFHLDLELNSNHLKLNSYLIKVIPNPISSSTREIGVIDMSDDEMSKIGDSIKGEKILEIESNQVEITHLKPSSEYVCYIYANVTSLSTNETRNVLLEKKLILRSQESVKLFFIDSSSAYLFLSFIALVIFCPIVAFLFVERKRLFKADTDGELNLPKYKPISNSNEDVSNELKTPYDLNIYILDDNQLLIEKSEY